MQARPPDSLRSKRTALAFAPVDAPTIDISEIDDPKAIVSAKIYAIDDRDPDVFEVGIDAIDGPGHIFPCGRAPEYLRFSFAPWTQGASRWLIGKDGGIAARHREARDLDDRFTLIDTLPMRRAEIAERELGCASNRKSPARIARRPRKNRKAQKTLLPAATKTPGRDT